MSPASRIHPPNSYVMTIPGYPVKSTHSTINASLYMAISHATVTSRVIANVCGAKRTTPTQPVVPAIYPGLMVRPVIIISIGVKRANVCRVKVIFVK